MFNGMLSYPSDAEIERLKSMISFYFPIYRVSVNYDAIGFFCEIDENELENNFDRLRIKMRDAGYIPILKERKGEYIIFVKRYPRQKFRGKKLNLLMFTITLLTTAIAGMFQWAGYVGSNSIFTFENFIYGELFFSIPLLTILGVHEMGHYLMAKRRNVSASLPFFIPFMPPLGTMGAFISIREPIPDKKSLLDIGIAGPIAGFLVAIPVSIVGIMLGNMNPQPISATAGGNVLIIELPIIYRMISAFIPFDGVMHPTAFAGWVGFLVTAINLLPAGQLDGGHIVRALFGDRAKYVSYASVFLLLGLGLLYPGWLIFGFLIIFLGLNHVPPLNDVSKLKPDRKVLGVLGIVLLIICFVPIPIQEMEQIHDVDAYIFPGESNNTVGYPDSSVYFNFTVKNNGTAKEDITLMIPDYPPGWSAYFFEYNSSNASSSFSFRMSPGEYRNLTLAVDIPQNVSSGNYTVGVLMSVRSGGSKFLNFNIIIPPQEAEVPRE